MNLASKYRPQTFDDVMEQSAIVDILKKICSDSELPNRNFLFIGPAGTGKAQPLYSKVLTPQGYITMADVQVGTIVIDGSGHATEVVGVYPQGERCCYSLEFDDGSSIQVADNHLNVVTIVDPYGTITTEVLTTEDLLKASPGLNSCNHYLVPICEVKCPGTIGSSFVDPYFVGAFAAHGQYAKKKILFDELPIESIARLNSILHDDWNCKLSAYRYGDSRQLKYEVVSEDGSVNSANRLLEELKIYFTELFSEHNKKLPDACLYSDSAYRRSLVAGLCANTKYGQFITSNLKLSEQYTQLVNSLGYKDIVKKCSEFVDGPMTLLYNHTTLNSSFRRIIHISKVGNTECKCIKVNSPTHTYITDNYTVTHNTTLGRIISKQLNGGTNGVIEIDAASHSGADAARDITAQARAYPVGSKWKCFIIDECHSISSQGWQVLLKTLEESPAKSIFVLCTTNPEKIPQTILSRVQTFRLSKISVDGITERLKHICDCEIVEGADLSYELDALRYIAKLGNGGMRDSIQLLDRAIAYNKNVTSENLAIALDLPNYDDYFALLSAISKKNNNEIVRVINEVYDSGTNFVKWFEGFHSFVCQIVKYIYLQDITKTMIPAYYQDKISNYGATHAVICLRLANTLMNLNHSLKTTNYLQEVAITYLCSSQKR